MIELLIMAGIGAVVVAAFGDKKKPSQGGPVAYYSNPSPRGRMSDAYVAKMAAEREQRRRQR